MSDLQNNAASGVNMRVYTGTHAILKALAGFEGVSMVELLDRVMREEAERKGFRIRDVRPRPPLDAQDREIAIPVR